MKKELLKKLWCVETLLAVILAALYVLYMIVMHGRLLA